MLNQKIRETIAQFREALPHELSALIEQGAGEISALDIIERALKVGEKAPNFEPAAPGRTRGVGQHPPRNRQERFAGRA